MTPGHDAAAVLSIGDELLSGDVADTNAAWLDVELTARGWPVREHRIVADDRSAIRDAVLNLAGRFGLVVVTGGLGPTDDDVTLEAIAAAAGVPLEPHAPTLEAIRQRFARKGRPLRDGHRRQAMLPEGATVVPNPRGSAPGLVLRVGRAHLFVLPGVPTEMQEVFGASGALLPAGPTDEQRRILYAVGLGETDLEARVQAIRATAPDVRFGFRSVGLVREVRLYGAARAVEAAAARAAEALEGHVYGLDAPSLAEALGRRLAARGETVATAESCTGGLVGAALTDVPGSSAYYLGGVVAYANAVKTDAVGVDAALLASEGAVSEGVARALAEGIRGRLGATYGLSTTGVAGPGGGTAEKPVGLVWIGGAGPDGSWSKRLVIDGDRATIRRRSVQHALAELWRRTDPGPDGPPEAAPVARSPDAGGGI